MEATPKHPQHSQQRTRRCSHDLIHLDVPLISTRRPSSPAATRLPDRRSVDTSRMVPFMWERVPGVPKDGMRRQLNTHKEDGFYFFPPKPPPGQRRNPPIRAGYCSEDDGNDGDVDSCSNGDSANGRLFCERIDKVSLPHPSPVDWREPRGLHRSPSFIMNRFLQAANALAATSTPAVPKQRTHRPPSTFPHRLQSEFLKSRQPQSTTWPEAEKAITIPQPHQHPMSSKACGFQLFLPWTFINKTPCGHKSPVLCQTPGSGAEKSGKNNRRFSLDLLRAKEQVGDDLSSKACKSPRWGLPFLDTSKLRLRGKEDERERGREFVAGGKGGGKPTWSLPRLHKPSEPWLLQALSNPTGKH